MAEYRSGSPDGQTSAEFSLNFKISHEGYGSALMCIRLNTEVGALTAEGASTSEAEQA